MTTKTDESKLLAKLLDVRRRVTAIIKDAHNKGQGFNYVSSSAVLNRLRPLLDDARLLLVPAVKGHASEALGKQILTHVDMDFMWIDVDTGAQIVCPWYAQGADMGEKGPGKAYTYAEKYFLLKFFNVPTDADDPDGGAQDAPQSPQGGKGTPPLRTQPEATDGPPTMAEHVNTNPATTKMIGAIKGISCGIWVKDNKPDWDRITSELTVLAAKHGAVVKLHTLADLQPELLTKDQASAMIEELKKLEDNVPF